VTPSVAAPGDTNPINATDDDDDFLSIEGWLPREQVQRHAFLLLWPWPWPHYFDNTNLTYIFRRCIYIGY